MAAASAGHGGLHPGRPLEQVGHVGLSELPTFVSILPHLVSSQLGMVQCVLQLMTALSCLSPGLESAARPGHRQGSCIYFYDALFGNREGGEASQGPLADKKHLASSPGKARKRVEPASAVRKYRPTA